MAQRILVIQTAFLGDSVLSLPFLYRLAEAHPEASIDLVATGAGAELFALALERGLSPFRSRIHLKPFDKRGAHSGWKAGLRFARELQAGTGYDVSFCLQRSFRSAAIAYAAGARTRVGFGSGSVPFLSTLNVRREWDTGRREIDKNLDLLRAYAQEQGRSGSSINFDWVPETAPSLLATAPTPLSSHRRPLEEKTVVLSLGSPWATKRWPVENALPLVEQLVAQGIEVKLLGDTQTKPIYTSLCEKVPSLLLKDLSGQTTIAQWVNEIANSDAVVSGDSAAVHVASDLGVPVVALFGPTLPDFGFAPWRRNSRVLGADLSCRPCHVHGPRECPLKHHRCLRDMGADSVGKHLAAVMDPRSGTGYSQLR